MATQPSPTQLGITLGQSLTSIANAQNQAAKANYEQAVAAYSATYGTEPAPGSPAPPTPPTLTLVDANAVLALELQANALLIAGKAAGLDLLDWNSIYSYVQYVPPVPVPQTPAITTHTGTPVMTPFGEEWIP